MRYAIPSKRFLAWLCIVLVLVNAVMVWVTITAVVWGLNEQREKEKLIEDVRDFFRKLQKRLDGKKYKQSNGEYYGERNSET